MIQVSLAVFFVKSQKNYCFILSYITSELQRKGMKMKELSVTPLLKKTVITMTMVIMMTTITD